MAEIGDEGNDVLTALYNGVYTRIDEREAKLEKIRTDIQRMLTTGQNLNEVRRVTMIEKIRKVLHEKDGSEGQSWEEVAKKEEKEIIKLEGRENELVKDFNNVMTNLYLLPGYVLTISTGVAGLLASDPKGCRLFGIVVLVAVSFVPAVVCPVMYVYRQILRLNIKNQELLQERGGLLVHFENHKDNFDQMKDETETDQIAKRLSNFEATNFKLACQEYYYVKFLLLIVICGVLYMIMFVLAGKHVLCGKDGLRRNCF